MAPVSVVTATIPGREEMLAECVRAVYAQTVAVSHHVIVAKTPYPDLERPVDLALSLNTAMLASGAIGWVAFCDDDNLWLPEHVEGLLKTADEHPLADVVYHPSTGTYQPFRQTSYWSNELCKSELARKNWIDPNGAMVRVESIDRAGGLRSYKFTPWVQVGDNEVVGGYLDTGTSSDDWDFWMRLALTGSTFATARRHTWTYRDGPWRHGSDDFFDVVRGGQS